METKYVHPLEDGKKPSVLKRLTLSLKYREMYIVFDAETSVVTVTHQSLEGYHKVWAVAPSLKGAQKRQKQVHFHVSFRQMYDIVYHCMVLLFL